MLGQTHWTTSKHTRMKIKFNWGTGIVIAIVLMVSGIMTLVFIATKQDYYLVEDDYYQKAINYQEQIDRIDNANHLPEKPTLTMNGKTLSLQLPSVFKGKAVSGQVHIYSPVSNNRDTSVSLQPDTALAQLISLEKLPEGRYTVKLDWTADSTDYYLEQNITR